MAEELISPFILDSIRDLVIHEAQSLCDVGDQVQKLEQQLNQMHWFLRDPFANQERVLDCVIQVRNLAYEAEYLIGSYAIKVASRGQGGIRGTIKRIAGGLNGYYHLNQTELGIATVMRKISDLTSSFNEFGIRQIMENTDYRASRRPLLRRSYSMSTDENEFFVGSDDSVNMLAEKLVSDQYRTVCLHGMGGLGKTTLARKVYHHPVVMEHFDGFAWVSISQQWDKDDILRGILIKLMPDQKRDDIQKWRKEDLVRELSQFLHTSKCLVLLDDIWSIDAWDEIKSAIPIKENGCKALITTRNIKVGTLMDASGYKYEPMFLTADESLELLCNKAMRGQDSEETMKIKKVGKEIIAQCGGLPLAVVAIGEILSSKFSYSEWENVRDNMKSYLLNDRKNVKSILALSYDDLPFQLKPCFLYLSKYAEDAEIAVETLYQFWMAEEMVSSKDLMGNDETIMDVAEHYLNELAERSMVFVEKEENCSFRRFKSCRLNGLMRDLCVFKAKEEKFLRSIDYGKIHEESTICRLSISFPERDDAKRFVPPAKAVKISLRSFFLEGHKGITLKLNFSEFVMLRVLSLDGVGIEDDGGSPAVCSVVYHKKLDPLSIGKLLHLRYLSLRNTTFCIMSSSISNLKLLQTLDLRGSYNFCWISDVWNLPQLNHLYLPINIELGDVARKVGFEGMPQLEILEGFNPTVCNVKHLLTLPNLRRLKARVEDELEDLEELINHVRKLTKLPFLELRIEIRDLSSQTAVAIINNILSCSSLGMLYIRGKLSKFPEHDSGFGWNLQSLTLDICEIKEDPLHALERLANLRTLALRAYSFVGKEMICHASGFPKLRFLTLWELYKLEKWEIEDGAMPNLSELTIGRCFKLEMIPAGLRSNTLLKELDICKMPEEFKKRVIVNEDGEEGPDFRKVSHVQTINVGRGHPYRNMADNVVGGSCDENLPPLDGDSTSTSAIAQDVPSQKSRRGKRDIVLMKNDGQIDDDVQQVINTTVSNKTIVRMGARDTESRSMRDVEFDQLKEMMFALNQKMESRIGARDTKSPYTQVPLVFQSEEGSFSTFDPALITEMYLADDGDNQQRSRIMFISPNMNVDHNHLADILLKYQSQDDLILISFNIRGHRVLVAINTKTDNIYYSDSLRLHHDHPDRAVLVENVNKAMITYRSLKQGVSRRKRLSHNQWISVHVPRQDLTSSYCGFYDVRDMGSRMEQRMDERMGARVTKSLSTQVSPVFQSEEGSCRTVQEASRLDKSVDDSVTLIGPRKKLVFSRVGDVDNDVGFLLCKSYARYCKDGDDVYDVAMPEPFFEVGYTEHVGLENLKEILNIGWLSASTICFYIRYLIDLYLVDGKDDQQRSKFVFISPHMDADCTHVAGVLLKHQSQDELVLIPYNISAHWVLVAINTKSDCIYYFDPLRLDHGHPGRALLVENINSAMITYRRLKQCALSKQRLSDNQWINVECPRQDPTSGYCGFYVCLFIQDILQSDKTTLSLAYPHQHRCDTFPMNRIIEVQKSWCSYLYNGYMEKL